MLGILIEIPKLLSILEKCHKIKILLEIHKFMKINEKMNLEIIIEDKIVKVL